MHDVKLWGFVCFWYLGNSKSGKNVYDISYSLTMVRSGTASKQSGPFLFLGREKNKIVELR